MVTVTGAFLLSGCTDAGDRGLGPDCESRLTAAENELGHAKANSIGKSIDWARAAALIAAARTQQQFDEFQNCVIKADSARKIIAESR
ncbi:MAG: hypothetical protein WD075_01155 [Rhodospirillales bacterium]